MLHFNAIDMDYNYLTTGSPKAIITAKGQMPHFLTGYNVGNTTS